MQLNFVHENQNISDGTKQSSVINATETLQRLPALELILPVNPTSIENKNKRISDTIRVQKVLDELSAKSALPDKLITGRYKRQKINNDARVLLLQYAHDVTSAILEESCLLTKHRNSKELNIADVKLIFGKISYSI